MYFQLEMIITAKLSQLQFDIVYPNSVTYRHEVNFEHTCDWKPNDCSITEIQYIYKIPALTDIHTDFQTFQIVNATCFQLPNIRGHKS